MLIGEPPRTQADLNFEIFGIPVRIHPFFWVVALLLGIGPDGKAEPVGMLLWIVAFFACILIHELGHAFAAKHFGWQPWITLYGMGGLASYNATGHAPRQRIIICAAGPAAGFLFAAVILLGILLARHQVSFVPSIVPVRFEGFEAPHVNTLLSNLLVINIFWGLINLFPVYPLDGGQIAREVLVEREPYNGIRQSLWLSIIAATGLAVFALTRQSILMTLMFGYLAYTSYATLQSYSGHGGQRW